MRVGYKGFLKGGTSDRIDWIPVKVNVVRSDGGVTFQHFGGFQVWNLSPSEVKELFHKKIPRKKG